MKYLKIIAGFFMGGGGLWSYALWAALGAAVVGGGALWHGSKVDAAFKAGKASAKAEYVAAENRSLLIQQERISALIAEVKVAQDEYESQTREVAQLRDRLAASQRLRDAERRQFDASVRAATADRLRDYAQACDANFERSRSHVERFGLEAVECSKAAHALKRSNDALSRPTPPSAPRPPSRP